MFIRWTHETVTKLTANSIMEGLAQSGIVMMKWSNFRLAVFLPHRLLIKKRPMDDLLST